VIFQPPNYADSSDLRAVDLFCGIGGLTYGLRMAGIDVQAGIDFDSTCRYAYEANNDGVQFITADIRNIRKNDITPYFENAEIRVIVGCAPCQPFSSHTGKMKPRKFDPSWTLIHELLRVVLDCKPEIISMENVPRLMKQPIYESFKQVLHGAGYRISDRIVDCSEFGVPQSRRRLVMFASLLGEFIFPNLSCTVPKTVKDVIGHLPVLEHGQSNEIDPLHVCSHLEPLNLKRIRASIPGGSWRDWPEALLPECYKKESGKSYGSVYGRMVWDKVGPTITTQFYRYGTGRFGHPEQDRALSLREGALLQTFPLHYQLIQPEKDVNFSQTGRHVGNAVPPDLSYIIGNAIISHANQRG